MEEDVIALFIPMALFLMVGVIVWLIFHFRFRTNAETQATVRLALEKGNELTPDLIDRLGTPKPHAKQDLRRGIVWVSIAAGMALLGFFVPDPSNHAFKGMLATAALPFMIGVGYLVMYKVVGPKDAN